MKKFWLISILLGVGLSYVFSQDSIVSIPDTNFLNALINEGVDNNGDGKISYAEAEAVTELIVSSNGISSLEGIQAFTHLDIISVDNNQLSSLDFTNNTALSGISCQHSKRNPIRPKYF